MYVRRHTARFITMLGLNLKTICYYKDDDVGFKSENQDLH